MNITEQIFTHHLNIFQHDLVFSVVMQYLQ